MLPHAPVVPTASRPAGETREQNGDDFKFDDQGVTPETLRGIAEVCRSPYLYLLFLFTLAVVTLSYQARPTQIINVGSNDDIAWVDIDNWDNRQPLIAHNDVDPQLNWRWTTSTSTLHFSAAGSQPYSLILHLTAAERALTTTVPVDILVNGIMVKQISAGKDWADYTVDLPATISGSGAGNFDITLKSKTFKPANPAKLTVPAVNYNDRGIGVAIDRVTLAPVNRTGSNLIIPPLWELIGWPLGMALLYAIALLGQPYRLRNPFFTRRDGRVTDRTLNKGKERPDLYPLLVFAGGTVLSLIVGYLLATEREWWSFYAPQALVIPLLGAGVGLVAFFLTRTLSRWVKLEKVKPGEMRLVALAVSAGFMILYGGLVYPRFQSSDWLFHMHNLEKVVTGLTSPAHDTLWLSAALPTGKLAPYPIAFYVLLAPFTRPGMTAGGNFDTGYMLTLLRFSGASLFMLSLTAVWLGTRRLSGSARVALLTVGMAALYPATYIFFSAGNYTNIFGQVVFNCLFATLACYTTSTPSFVRFPFPFRQRQPIPDTASEPQNSLTAKTSGFEVDSKSPPKGKATPWRWFVPLTFLYMLAYLSHYGVMLMTIALTGLLVLLLVIFQRRYTPALIVASAAALALCGAVLLFYMHGPIPGLIGDQVASFLQGSAGRGKTTIPSFPQLIEDIWLTMRDGVGGSLTIGAFAGLALLFADISVSGPQKYNEEAKERSRRALPLIMAWSMTAFVFAILSSAVNLQSRYDFFVLPVVLTLAGIWLARLWHYGRVARLVVLIILLFVCWQAAHQWYYQIAQVYTSER